MLLYNSDILKSNAYPRPEQPCSCADQGVLLNLRTAEDVIVPGVVIHL